MKPFVKLFATPNAKYVFDVGKNEILKVTDEIYNFLEGLEKNSDVLISPETKHNIDLLMGAGYFSDKRPLRIRHPNTDLAELFLERKIDKITLQLTQDCNFRCKYCIYSEDTNNMQRTHSQKNMSLETGKKAIDFFCQHSIDSPQRDVGFYGGEPLLQFELLKELVEYAEKQLFGRPLTFHLTSNGFLLTDTVVDFLVEHDVSLLVSLDGPQETHDKNRVTKAGYGTYKVIIRNLRRIAERYPEYYKKLRINMVVDPRGDFSIMMDPMDDLRELPKGNIGISFVENTDYEIHSSKHFAESYQQAKKRILKEQFEKGIDQVDTPFAVQVVGEARRYKTEMKATTGMPESIAPSGPCIPGKSRLFISVDGLFYPCEKTNESELMCIGSLTEGFRISRVKELLNIGTLTEEECKNCWAIRHCTLCAKTVDGGAELSAGKKIKQCPQVRNHLEEKIQLLIFLDELKSDYERNGSL